MHDFQSSDFLTFSFSQFFSTKKCLNQPGKLKECNTGINDPGYLQY